MRIGGFLIIIDRINKAKKQIIRGRLSTLSIADYFIDNTNLCNSPNVKFE